MFTKIWRVHRIATHTKTKGQADKIKVGTFFTFWRQGHLAKHKYEAIEKIKILLIQCKIPF